MVDSSASLHILLISFPGQGHVNPLLRLAKRLAAKGLLVTFSSTSAIGRQITSSTSADPEAADRGFPVGLGRLRFEFMHDEAHSTELDKLMSNLETIGPLAFADLIRRQAAAGRPVSCVINNAFIPWAIDVATDMGIPCGVLWIQSCAVFSTYFHYYHSLANFPSESDPNISVSLPGLPTMTSEEIPSFLLPSNPYKSLTKVILEQFRNIHKASWVFANSFDELEADTIAALSNLSPLIPIGPLVETDDDSKSTVRGDFLKAADCKAWLDAQAPSTVIYVSLGSIVALDKDDMAEMAYGLKGTGRPFLWVVREESQGLLPEGFLDEMQGKGNVVGWSPQDQVLNHGAVGCFLTHCGWNSMLEALTAGVPVVAYPQWGDQVTDAKFFVEVYKVGVRLRAPVTREALQGCVEEVMVGEEAEAIKKRAAEWKKAAGKAIAEGGSSDANIQAFVDEIRGRVCGEKTGVVGV
ncbi:gallate 1-beta-glucosyltransferase 84A24-like [Typha angustifolia]|uniref:gallate 1-beta-glucosyltransferase 84A24-like n=1 Tax=Typha angustifolia TaxID=59011 RepID=UPI003C2BC408